MSGILAVCSLTQWVELLPTTDESECEVAAHPKTTFDSQLSAKYFLYAIEVEVGD